LVTHFWGGSGTAYLHPGGPHTEPRFWSHMSGVIRAHRPTSEMPAACPQVAMPQYLAPRNRSAVATKQASNMTAALPASICNPAPFCAQKQIGSTYTEQPPKCQPHAFRQLLCRNLFRPGNRSAVATPTSLRNAGRAPSDRNLLHPETDRQYLHRTDSEMPAARPQTAAMPQPRAHRNRSAVATPTSLRNAGRMPSAEIAAMPPETDRQ